MRDYINIRPLKFLMKLKVGNNLSKQIEEQLAKEILLKMFYFLRLIKIDNPTDFDFLYY